MAEARPETFGCERRGRETVAVYNRLVQNYYS